MFIPLSLEQNTQNMSRTSEWIVPIHRKLIVLFIVHSHVVIYSISLRETVGH